MNTEQQFHIGSMVEWKVFLVNTEEHFQIGTNVEWTFFSEYRTILSDRYNGRVDIL